MKILLTNDDGIDAPGLAALWQAAKMLGEPVIVAPLLAHSGCSHRVTTDRPLRIVRLDEHRYSVDGTPADCVRVALHSFAADTEWVFSGINAGGNLGADVHHSGTVAAVRECVLHGRSGIAVSQYHKRGISIDWDRATRWVEPLLMKFTQHAEPDGFWNINLPQLESGAPDPEVVTCSLDMMPLPLSFRDEAGVLHYDGDYHQRARRPGTDVDVCFGGRIAVTRLRIA